MCFYWVFIFSKGYKCFDPNTKKIFVTMDGTFFENKYFFGNDHLQEGKTNEDSPELFENLIISEDVYTSHNSVPCTSAPKENALEK